MERYGKRLRLAAALGLIGLMASAGTARAGFTITLESTAPSGPNTQFNFSAAIDAADTLTAGDFFRIYDFAGLVGTPTAPAGWTATVQNSSPTPPPDVILSHGDVATLPNLIFTYNDGPVAGPLSIIGFSAISSINNLIVTKDFAGRVTKGTGPTAGSPVDSVGDIRVPGVPEPASVISTSLGMLVLGSAYGLRQRRKARVELV